MLTLRKSLGTLFLLSLMLTSSVGSSSNILAQTPTAPAVRSKHETLTKEELYFGLSKPKGGLISEAQWEQFLNSEITPRFRDGLTVLDGYGQYLDSAGILTREKTKVVILIYSPSSEKNQAINEIIDSYKQKFQQESVLRVSSTVQVSF
ncbi:MAG TPA: DUF3574 domain-containing protein [Cyanobacteria bacterium UBA8553]|nr:DUF3574 domain-containing protein [Cyanobacteria bacterium UBA8553]